MSSSRRTFRSLYVLLFNSYFVNFLSSFLLTIYPLFYKVRSVNPIAVQWCVGRQKQRSAFAVQASGGVAASKPVFGPFPVGWGVKSGACERVW